MHFGQLKYLAFVWFLCVGALSHAQDFKLFSKVEEGKLFIRLVPENHAALKLIWENDLTLEGDGFPATMFMAAKGVANELNDQGLKDYYELIRSAVKPEDKKIAWAAVVFEGSRNAEFSRNTNLLFEFPLENGTTIGQLKLGVKGRKWSESFPNMPALPPVELTGKIKRKVAELSWPAKALQNAYTGYFVEKSLDGNAFAKLNKVPLNFAVSEYEKERENMFHSDTFPKKPSTQFYRVVAVDYFSSESTMSNVIELTSKKLLTGYTQIDSVKKENETITLFGSLIEPDSKNQELPEKIDVYLGSGPKSAPKLLGEASLKGSNFSFEYSSSMYPFKGYFYAEAVIKSNDSSRSYPKYFFEYDQIPPLQPEGLKGRIDSMGIVTLTWNVPTDKDVQGYKIYRANSLSEEWLPINSDGFAEGTKFLDTMSLNTLTNEVYYCIAAVDSNFNNSPKSEGIKLMKPDKIAPVPAFIKSAQNLENGIHLKIINSSSTDLAKQVLLKTANGTTESIILDISETTEQVYLDSSVSLGDDLSYAIKTFDLSGNSSASKALYLTALKKEARPILSSSVNRKEKHIKLSWTTNQDLYSVEVYRQKNDEKMRLLKTVYDDQSQFLDANLAINNTYSYQIRLIFKTGKMSGFSDSIEVIY